MIIIKFQIGEQVKVVGNHYDYFAKGLIGIVRKHYPMNELQYDVSFVRDDGKLPMEFNESIDERDLSHVEMKRR